jgi:predicted transcriptional regulator
VTEPEITVFRPLRPGIRKVLGDLEAEVMELIWKRRAPEGLTVRAVFEILRRRRRVAYTTVMTTMARLARKKLLYTKKQGQAYVYYPSVTKDAFIAGFIGRILENLMVSFTGATIERLRSLASAKTEARARQLLGEIARRREEEEDGG